MRCFVSLVFLILANVEREPKNYQKNYFAFVRAFYVLILIKDCIHFSLTLELVKFSFVKICSFL